MGNWIRGIWSDSDLVGDLEHLNSAGLSFPVEAAFPFLA